MRIFLVVLALWCSSCTGGSPTSYRDIDTAGIRHSDSIVAAVEKDAVSSDSTIQILQNKVGGVLKLYSQESPQKCNLYQECYSVNNKRQQLKVEDLKALAKALAQRAHQDSRMNNDCRYVKMVQVYLFLSPDQMRPDPKGIAMGDYVALCNISPTDPEGRVTIDEYILAHGKY